MSDSRPILPSATIGRHAISSNDNQHKSDISFENISFEPPTPESFLVTEISPVVMYGVKTYFIRLNDVDLDERGDKQTFLSPLCKSTSYHALL